MSNSNSFGLEQNQLGHFGFSSTSINDLGASEYTLVGIVVDRSTSTRGFQDSMENALQSIVKACMQSPRADNLMLRLVAFDTHVEEIHGFKLLSDINLDEYKGILSPRGRTALNDATINVIESLNNYGKQLIDNDFSVNAAAYIITDGDENESKHAVSYVKSALAQSISKETLESLVSILIGINITDPYIGQRLAEFKEQAGLGEYKEIDNADPKTLARLAGFVSKSISSQSQALGTGAPSASVTF